ncbi:MAG: DUF4250 domain-containing protein [Clostridia bacterium]|jgi:hypothetical protein|nr:DUF4250 domain-containing protein [Clostridia bacterium]
MMMQDNAVLFSYVNTKLRDEFASIEELCAALDYDRAELESRLAAAGYRYDEEQNRFV